MLYTLNLDNAICQYYLKKAGKTKHDAWEIVNPLDKMSVFTHDQCQIK